MSFAQIKDLVIMTLENSKEGKYNYKTKSLIRAVISFISLLYICFRFVKMKTNRERKDRIKC